MLVLSGDPQTVSGIFSYTGITNSILDSNWDDILYTESDKVKDQKLKAKGLSGEPLLRARKAAHRNAIQRWWMLSKEQTMGDIIRTIAVSPANVASIAH